GYEWYAKRSLGRAAGAAGASSTAAPRSGVPLSRWISPATSETLASANELPDRFTMVAHPLSSTLCSSASRTAEYSALHSIPPVRYESVPFSSPPLADSICHRSEGRVRSLRRDGN